MLTNVSKPPKELVFKILEIIYPKHGVIATYCFRRNTIDIPNEKCKFIVEECYPDEFQAVLQKIAKDVSKLLYSGSKLTLELFKSFIIVHIAEEFKVNPVDTGDRQMNLSYSCNMILQECVDKINRIEIDNLRLYQGLSMEELLSEMQTCFEQYQKDGKDYSSNRYGHILPWSDLCIREEKMKLLMTEFKHRNGVKD